MPSWLVLYVEAGRHRSRDRVRHRASSMCSPLPPPRRLRLGRHRTRLSVVTLCWVFLVTGFVATIAAIEVEQRQEAHLSGHGPHAGLTSSHPHEPIGVASLGFALITKVSPLIVSRSPGRGLATSLARSSKLAVSARMRVSPKPTTASGRFAITRTGTGSPPAGVDRPPGVARQAVGVGVRVPSSSS